jgi:hypothetical protein
MGFPGGRSRLSLAARLLALAALAACTSTPDYPNCENDQH